MATQPCLLGFTDYTVDAIARTAIYPKYAYRQRGEGSLINAGSVTVNLYSDATSTDAYPLIAGEAMPFNSGEPRGRTFAPDTPICYAKAASGTGTLRVVER